MSLVRFSHTQNSIVDLNNKIRHIYDLNQLLQNKEIYDFFNSKEFDNLLLTVANDDKLSFQTGTEWLKIHPTEAMIFKKIDDTWDKLKTTYSSTFRKLVYGDLPKETEIKETLKIINNRMKKMKWEIK